MKVQRRIQPEDTLDGVLWWNGLDSADRADVRAWLHRSPPPESWQGTHVEWAYTECPLGLFSRRYGRLL